ncbi:SIP domain-containing protein [Leucobacter sp. M11]|uniref:SIP domain-containing protein n=1 Tax=Leucobacter sp. M11 TaxID=2993565 RepID=UPI002D7FF5C1|nr:SIP domain-containing protein [Leucobacter sp. M11]MEB4614053.1 SIP domain-containing protein [Leucobacter sp. M11]
MSEPQHPVPVSKSVVLPGDWVLAGGDASDLPALQLWLNSQPRTSFGRVFVEVFSSIQIVPLHAPPGIGITWLCREDRSPSPMPGIGAPRGEALVHAVDGWLDEWLRADDCDALGWHIWLGARTSSVVASFGARLERELDGRTPRQCSSPDHE